MNSELATFNTARPCYNVGLEDYGADGMVCTIQAPTPSFQPVPSSFYDQARPFANPLVYKSIPNNPYCQYST